MGTNMMRFIFFVCNQDFKVDDVENKKQFL